MSTTSFQAQSVEASPSREFQVTPAHADIFQAIDDATGGNLLISAVAGSGKTSTLVQCLKRIPTTQTVLFLAFNKKIADELRNRVPAHVDVATLNALGHRAYIGAMRERGISVKLDTNKTRSVGIQCLGKDTWTVHGGKISKLVRLAKSAGLFPGAGIVPDVSASWSHLIAHHDVIDADSKIDPDTLIQHSREVLRESCKVQDLIDFDDQLLLTYAFNLPVPKFDWVFVDESQDLSPLQHELVARAIKDGGRLVAVGDPHQCHPAGTMVDLTGGKRIPIEDVEVGMELVTYHDCFRGIGSQGRRVLKTAVSMNDIGELVCINAGNENVEVTPDHRIPTRMRDDGTKRWCVYVMQTGKTCRLGSCQLMYAHGFGPAMRLRHERADDVWVLRVFTDKEDAMLYETEQSLKFGIPENIFFEKGRIKQRLMDMVGDNSHRAINCLSAHGRMYEHPAFSRGQDRHLGRYLFITQACNLIDGVNEVRTFDGTRDGGSWELVTTTRRDFGGCVFSLSVEPTEGGHRLYVADRILVHNSIYGFRGAAMDSMAVLGERFRCRELPLHVSYRCAQSIVRAAQQHVSHIQAHESAPEGTVIEQPVDVLKAGIKAGDMVVCRFTAPVVKAAFVFLGEGLPATILGRDIGTNLITLLKKLNAGSISDVNEKLNTWEDKERSKANDKGDEAKAEAVSDKADALRTFLDSATSVEETIAKIESVFADDSPENVITCCTVHKSKGLEAERVFIVNRHRMPSKWAKQEWQKEQETNLLYVAITRAKMHLQMVTVGDERKPALKQDAAAQKMVAIRGNTYPVKDRLNKELGAKWDAAAKVWMIRADRHAQAMAIVNGTPARSPRAHVGVRTSGMRGRTWRPCGYPGCNRSHCDECDGSGGEYEGRN